MGLQPWPKTHCDAQRRCKPGYVRNNFRSASVIYLCRQLPAGYSSLPPGNGRTILDCRCIWPCNPQDVRRHMSPCGPVVSYTRLFTLTRRLAPPGGRSLSLIPDIAASFPLENAASCVARTFLYGPAGRSDRPRLCVVSSIFLYKIIIFSSFSQLLWRYPLF